MLFLLPGAPVVFLEPGQTYAFARDFAAVVLVFFSANGAGGPSVAVCGP